jgi:hypothetical protein
VAQFSDDFFRLRGRVIAARPLISPDFVNNALNDRLRQILDHRTFWADLLTFGNLSFPDPYTTGTVSVDTGDATVTGDGTNAWPVNDKVNAIIPDGVPEFGVARVAPSTMAGIDYQSMLYVDDGGLNPEVVPVLEVGRTDFVAKFAYQHDPNCAITQSSLTNQQFRMSSQYPIFTVKAVTSANTLELNLPWGGPAITAQPYRIMVVYVTLAPDLKAIIAMKDESTGFSVRLHVPTDEVDFRDPQRSLVSGNPWYALVDWGANDQGNMVYEVWPAPQSARQFSYAFWRQWPQMEKDTDRPPPFINPSILFYGALADAKMMRVQKDDPYFDPEGARWYEQKFLMGLQEAKNADECKRLEAMRNPFWKTMFPGSYDTLQLNDPAMMSFWSSGY